MARVICPPTNIPTRLCVKKRTAKVEDLEKYSAAREKTRNRKIRKGDCAWAGCDQKAEPGRLMCQKHLDYHAASAALRRDEAGANGDCKACGVPLGPELHEFEYCKGCRKRRRGYNAECRARKRERGECFKCSKPAVVLPNGRVLTHCQEHREACNRPVLKGAT